MAFIHLRTRPLAGPALLALAAFSFAPTPVSARPVPATAVAQEDRKEEFKERYDAAKGDRDALWELHQWCDAFGMDKESRRVLRAILKVDDGDRRAHELLGHLEHDGKWFDSQKDLDEYLAEQAAAEAKAKGFVRFRGDWVDPEHIPFLEKGLFLLDDGRWVTADEKKRLDEGWRQQDLNWIGPDEFEQLDAGLWKIGDRWVEIEEADKFHSELGQWWKIPGENFELWTTLPRAKAMEAMGIMDKAVRELKKFFGRKPAITPRVVLVNSLDQYNTLAGGQFDETETDAAGLSGVYAGYFADIWWNHEVGEFMRAAVAYWDPSTEAGDKFGLHAARFAAGMAWTEAMDPSPKFEAKFGKKLRGKKPSYREADLAAFWKEKRIPPFLRYGVAVWTERYFIDRTATDGDPSWARKWSVSNIERRGGIDPVTKIVEMQLESGSEEAASQAGKMINQAGLIVAFLVDGGHAPAEEALAAWREAFLDGNDLDEATNALIQALVDSEAEIRQFAKS